MPFNNIRSFCVTSVTAELPWSVRFCVERLQVLILVVLCIWDVLVVLRQSLQSKLNSRQLLSRILRYIWDACVVVPWVICEVACHCHDTIAAACKRFLQRIQILRAKRRCQGCIHARIFLYCSGLYRQSVDIFGVPD